MTPKLQPNPASKKSAKKLSRFIAQAGKCACGGDMHMRSLPAGDPHYAVYDRDDKTLVHLKCRK